MSDINTVTIVGRVGADPELRDAGQSKVCSLGLANSTHKKNKTTGEWDEETSWLDVTFWGNQAEQVAERVRKGHRVAVNGRLKKRVWEAKDGTKRSAIDIIANQVQFFEKKGKGAEADSEDVPF